jgi:WD40 repeat protein/tetratricopeptide (TPR) repeat protein
MNAISTAVKSEIAPFSSLTRMREAHTELIRRHRDGGSSPEQEFVEAVFEFIRRGRATGTILDEDADRCTAQGLLDFWLTIIYRIGSDVPEAETTLADFDISRQPELKSSDCPYVGFEAFSETNADFFFGRQDLVKQWIATLAERRVLTVVGPTGSGKKSLISAGVFPALRSGALPGSEDWRYFPLITPGAHPLRSVVEGVSGSAARDVDELVSAMRRSSKVLLSMVKRGNDQPVILAFPRFEEVFTLANAEDRKALANNLLELVEAPGNHRVLVAIRNEFLPHLGQLGALQAQLQKGEVFVPPFDASELREVVEKPAERVGLKFEDGLVDALIFDVLGDPAALPLLQFTLLKLWDRRERNRVTWKGFRQIGGCRGAIEQAAEEMYSTLDSFEEEILKGILLRIVRPGAAREVICSTVQRASLYEGAESHARVDSVIDALIRVGLVRISKDQTANQRLCVVHEALVTKWPRLVDWLEDERTKLRQRHRLAIAAAQWKEKQEDPGALWGGLLLEEARSYCDLNDVEREFVDASAKAKANKDRLRRRVKTAGVVALAAVVFLLVLNVWQAYRNLKETRKALRMAYIERGMRLLDAGDPAGGAVWFAQLFKLKPPNQIKTDVYCRRLEIGLRQLPWLLQLLPHDREAVYSEMSRDGLHIVTLTSGVDRSVEPSDSSWAQGKKTAWLWTIKDTGSAQPHQLKSELPTNGVCISPDGSFAATAHGDDKGAGEIRIWNITGNEPACIHRLSLDGAVTLVTWSPDSTRVAFAQEIGATHGKVSVWDWKSETQPGKSSDHEDKIALLVWSPAGNAIAFVDQQKGEARVWDLASPSSTLITLKLETSIKDVVFNSNGSRVLTAAGIQPMEVGPEQTETGAAQIWNTKTGERVGPPLPHKGAVLTAQFSPDDKLVVTASTDGTAKVWSAASGRELLALPHDGWVLSATFSPDGRHIATGGRDRMAHVWDLLSGQLAIPPMNHGGTVKMIAFSADGRRLITTSKETPRIWAFSTGINPPPALKVDGPILWAASSRDGRRIVTLSEADSGKKWKAQVWDAKSGHLESEYQHDEPLARAALSDDGSHMLLGISDPDSGVYRALVVDAANGRLRFPSISLFGDPSFLAFGKGKAPKFVILIRDDKGETTTAQVWDANTGKPLTEPLLHDVPVNFATFSPDNSQLLTTGGKRNPNTGKAFIWQLTNKGQKPIAVEHREFITHGEFSPDGQKIVTASEDNYASVWRTADGKVLSTLKNLHTADLTDVSFSPDGNQIVTASYDQTAVVSDWRKREIISILKHSGVVNNARFSPNGKHVATASADGTARLWDVQTNELIAVSKQGGSVRETAFIEGANALLAFSAATGPCASVQKGIPVSSVADDVQELPCLAVLAQISNIAVEPERSNTDLTAIAELLAVQAYAPNERLDIVPTEKLVKNWQRLKVSYLEGFHEEAEADYHARCAILSEAAKQWFAASWHLTKLLEKSPADPDLLQRRAMAYSRLRKNDLAIGDLSAALKSRPDDATLLNLRAKALVAEEEWEAAAQNCESLIARRDASSVTAGLTLAAVRCKQNRLDEATSQLRAIVDDYPDNTAARQRLALAQLKLGDLESYRNTCAKMLEKFKNKPKLGSMISWPCILNPGSVKDFSSIVELTRKAVELSPTNYYRVNTLAGALYRAGKYSEALAELERSRNLYANAVSARIAALRDDSFFALPPSEPRHGRAVDWAFLAMANFQMKQLTRVHTEIRQYQLRAEWWLGKLKQSVEGAAIGTELTADRQLWNRMELEILYEEAEALIHPVQPSARLP